MPLNAPSSKMTSKRLLASVLVGLAVGTLGGSSDSGALSLDFLC